MTEKKEGIVRTIPDTKHDIKRHQETTRELPTDSKVKNPFTSEKGNSGKLDSKKK